MAEKSEKATPKKLRDARKKGQVAKSQDFPAAFTFIASLSGVIFLAKVFYEDLASYMIMIFRSIPSSGNLETKASGYLASALHMIFTTSVPFMVIISVIGVLVGFMVVGPMFSMEAMKFDIKKLNPVDNLKNLFKVKTFVELLKSILKISGALILIYSVVYKSIPEIIHTAAMPPIGSAIIFSDFLVKVAIRVGLFFIIVAIFDLVFQKKNFAKQMMMEKYEIKQEVKDTEGDPHIKGRRRQAAQEIAYQEGPSSIKRAKAIVTNPVHIAIALEYESDKMPAPKILTMGKGLMADQIIKAAQVYQIPIMRNVVLAQQLYELGVISQFIPEETYPLVAEILRYLGELEAKEKEYEAGLFE